MATVRAPRSRARRSPAAAARRTVSAVVSARWPSPTTTTRRDGSSPLVWRWVTWPALPWNFSASSTSRERAAGRLVHARGRVAQLLVVGVDADHDGVGGDRGQRLAATTETFMRRPPLGERLRPPDHVQQPIGRVESLHLVHLHPARLVGVAGRAQRRPTRRNAT